MKNDKQIMKLLHESNLIEGYDRKDFDAQAWVAWDYMRDVSLDQLDHHCIKKVQKILTLKQTDLRPDWRGYYRTIDVWIGGRVAPSPLLVQELIDAWLWRLTDEQLLKPVPMHIDFEHIHPFVDGNGRTGRLLMWWHQDKIGEPLIELTADDRWKYYEWFK